MKFLAVSSPHGFTTRDVWKRVCKGLEMNGQEVVAYDLLPRWRMFDWMINRVRAADYELPPGFKSNFLAYEPILGAAHYHRADAVIIVSPQYCPMPTIDLLRKTGIKTVAYFTECPYEDSLIAPIQAQHFDYVAVSDRNSVALFQSFTERVFYVPHSYDPAIHYPRGNGKMLRIPRHKTYRRTMVNSGNQSSKWVRVDSRPRNGIVFIGTIYPERRRFLQRVSWDGIPLDLYGMHNFRRDSRFHRYIRGDLQENEHVAEIYRRAIGSFNIHRRLRYGFRPGECIDEGEAYSAGPRVYELAACGTFQVSDYRQEIVDIFGDTMPLYRTPKELERTLRRAIEDPVWRSEMAEKQREAVQGRDCAWTMRGLLEAVA